MPAVCFGGDLWMRLPSLPSGVSGWGWWAFYAAAGLGVVAGVALAAAGALDGRPLWHDELYSLQVVQAPLGFAWSRYILPDVHPPLYSLLLSAWAWPFGTGETAARLPSLLAALASLAVLWRMGRAVLSGPALAIALLWFATHWVWVLYAQEARMYALAILGSTWLSLAFARLWTAPSPPPRASLAVFAAVALVTAMLHYMAMGLACVALLLLLLRFRRRPPLWPPLCIAGGLCLLWTLGHGAWVAHGDWIDEHLSHGLPGWLAALALLRFFFLPADPYTWDALPQPLHLQLLWAAPLFAYAALAWAWLRRAREGQAGGAGGARGAGRAGGARGAGPAGEAGVLAGQLLLLGGFLLLLVAVHEWRAVLVFRGMAVLLPIMALCVGCLAGLSGIRRPWALCALALLLGASSALTAWEAVEQCWHRLRPYDRAGAQEVARRLAEGANGARVYCHRCGLSVRTRFGDGNLAILAGGDGGLSRPARVDLHTAARHLVPPFFVPSTEGYVLRMLRDRHGFPIQVLTPGLGADADFQDWHFYSVHVPAEGAEEAKRAKE